MNFIDNFRAFYSKAAEYALAPSAHGIFSRIDQMLGHKTSLYKLRWLKSHQADPRTEMV